MSSTFWLDSDDEWDDDIYSSDSGSDKDDVKPQSRFADIDMEEDDEDDKRVTRSALEKSWDELTKSIKTLKNKMFINDWNTVATGTF
jgi:translation initiation factor 3 subunit C